MSEWKEYALTEMGTLQRGRSRHRPRYAFHLYGGPYPFIQTGEIRAASKYITSYDQTYSEAGLAQSKLWPAGTLCITIAANIAEVAILTFDACFPDSVLGFIPNKEKSDLDFVFYLLTYYQKELQQHGEGSVQDNINLGTFENIKFRFPDVNEQRIIGEMLSTLDNKIQLLNQQNETLEKLAETLFRQWFIEEADDSWEVGAIDDVVSMKGGTTPSTTEQRYWDGNIHWTSPRDLSNATSIYLFDTSRKITEDGLKQISSGLLPVGTLLLSSRAPIGYLAITEIPVAINQGYIAIICDKFVSNNFMFLWCKTNMDTIENAGNGSVFQEISKSAFRTLKFIVPPKEKLKKFDLEVAPLFQKIKSNTKQIQTLNKLRDTLLPKLMSGEITINE